MTGSDFPGHGHPEQYGPTRDLGEPPRVIPVPGNRRGVPRISFKKHGGDARGEGLRLPETGSSLGKGDYEQPAADRPAEQEAYVREARRESAAAIEVRLPPLAEFLASETKSQQYLRDSLRVAGETLDTAYHALEQEGKRSSRSLSPDQIIVTIRALQNEGWWDELLESHQLEDREAAKLAAHDLAAHVAGLGADDVQSDSLERLLIDIAILQRQVSSVRQNDGLLSPGRVRRYVSAAYGVAAQVMVGLIAASASAEASGAKVVPQVIYSAIGLTAATLMAEIYRRATHEFKAQTVQAQLQECHRRLIEAVGDLSIFLSRLTIPEPSNKDAFETVKNTTLAASFLVSYLEQLANACGWAERDAYCDALRVARTLLDRVRGIPSWQHFRDAQGMPQDLGGRLKAGLQKIPQYNRRIQTMRRELRDANARLREFTDFIDRLGVNQV